MENENKKPELDLTSPAPKPDLPKPRRRRSYKIDKEKLTGYVLDTLTQNINDRQERIMRRMDRAAKVKGWLPQKDFPWQGCANFPVPIMAIANLKTRGTLENAIKSMRPMLEASALQGRNSGKEKSITQLLDFQFFAENKGEQFIDDAVCNFVEDEAVYGLVGWVKETQTFHDTRVLPPWPVGADIMVSALQGLTTMFPTMISQEMTDDDGWDWEVAFEDENTKDLRTAAVKFYEMDDLKIQGCITTQATTHDGPLVRILDFEDVVYPARAANLQPPSATNPDGAPYVDVLFNVSLDTIQRRIQDKTYDQVDPDMEGEDWQRILGSRSAAGDGSDTDMPKQQKDEHEGTQVAISSDREDRQGVMRFGRFDVDGDGLEEDVIVWVLRDSKILLKVALLTEIYPGLPIRRPIVHESFISIPNRVAGQSQSELLEALQDASQILLDQHIDWGTLTNTPFFFFRAASGLKGEPIHIEPGTGHPIDNPQQDVHFPTWPTKDSSFALNTMAVLQQFVERISMISDPDLGRIPQGKASALRNVGTITALIQQGGGRSEQVLRRLFGFFSGVFELMHRLNRRYLPEEKEVRLIGMSEQGQDAYATVKAEDQNAEVDFRFKATLLNANKQVLSANLSEMAALILSPLAVQAGVVSIEEVYNLLRMKAEALDLDPDKVVKRPLLISGPKILAEEVISALVANEMPVGQPMEDPQMHLQKLVAFSQSEQFGFLTTPEQLQMLQAWMQKVQMLILQQQQLMMAVQGAPKQPGEEQDEQSDSVPSNATAENPKVNSNEMIDESIGTMPQ